jgi:hypothetical protein
LITKELQEQHEALCFKYKNATSLEEEDVQLQQFGLGGIFQGL